MRWIIPIFVGSMLLAALAALAGWGLYVEENARGAQEWKDAQARLQAAGENLDFRNLIPPPISDDRNLGAIPLFQLETDAQGDKQQPIALKNALQNMVGDNTWPRFGNQAKGERVDRGQLEKFISDRYQKVFPGRTGSLTPLQQFDALCPALAELRQAAASRPECRFPCDYQTNPPYLRALSGITENISLARIVNLHATLALDEGNPAIALQDIETVLKINEGIRQEPILISGLVAVGAAAVQLQSIGEGLQAHAWNEQQLAELERQLAQIDFLADGQLCLRGEALGFFAPMMDYTRDHRSDMASILTGVSPKDASLGLKIMWSMIPAGWFDLAKARSVTFDLQIASQTVDSTKRRAYPETCRLLKARTEAYRGYAPLKILLRITSGPMLNAISAFSNAQCHVDEARIACMLERYRLAHGSYPASLDLLMPDADHGVPSDLINGEPYHYKVQPDGTYLLYSVGWNQVDDGGKVVFWPESPNSIDREQGDWVWPHPAAK